MHLNFVEIVQFNEKLILKQKIKLKIDRFKRLRTPVNAFIVNLAIGDFGQCAVHSLGAYSTFRGRWAFGLWGENFSLFFN